MDGDVEKRKWGNIVKRKIKGKLIEDNVYRFKENGKKWEILSGRRNIRKKINMMVRKGRCWIKEEWGVIIIKDWGGCVVK